MSQEVDLEAFQSDVLHEIDELSKGEAVAQGAGDVIGGLVRKQFVALEAVVSEAVLKRKEIMRRLCPALKSAGNSAWDIAKVVTPILLPLIIAGTIALPLNSVIFAVLAIVIARMGVAAVCPGEEPKSE